MGQEAAPEAQRQAQQLAHVMRPLVFHLCRQVILT